MPKFNMNFTVNGNSVVCNLLNGEIQGRMKTRNNPAVKQLYRENGIIDSSPAITAFIKRHPRVFGNEKLIQSDGRNFFEGMLTLSPLAQTESYRPALRSRMKYEYDLTDAEVLGMEKFWDDFGELVESPEIQRIVSDTQDYKKSIENAWKLNETSIKEYIKSVLGYDPENVGKVNTYIMYPTFDIHRSHSIDASKTSFFFARRRDNDINKILAFLTHQAVQQPMLPYKNSMTGKQKDEFNAFITFLTDKDVYSQLTGKSSLDIVTQGEKGDVMGRVYPFWLGYRFRNADKEGLNPIEQIRKTIERDKKYFDALPEKSKKRKLYASYAFEKLDPEKISVLFRERRGITPYQFAETDFSQTDLVYKNRYCQKKKTDSTGDNLERR